MQIITYGILYKFLILLLWNFKDLNIEKNHENLLYNNKIVLF